MPGKLSQEIKVALDLDYRINTGDYIISKTKELSGEKIFTSGESNLWAQKSMCLKL